MNKEIETIVKFKDHMPSRILKDANSTLLTEYSYLDKQSAIFELIANGLF